jgi:hypothetical protein
MRTESETVGEVPAALQDLDEGGLERKRRIGHVMTLTTSYLTSAFVRDGFEWLLPVVFSRSTDPLWPDPGASIEKVDIPRCGAEDVLLKVRATSICGTDLHIYDWDAWAQSAIKPPLVFGHELAGGRAHALGACAAAKQIDASGNAAHERGDEHHERGGHVEVENLLDQPHRRFLRGAHDHPGRGGKHQRGDGQGQVHRPILPLLLQRSIAPA